MGVSHVVQVSSVSTSLTFKAQHDQIRTHPRRDRKNQYSRKRQGQPRVVQHHSRQTLAFSDERLTGSHAFGTTQRNVAFWNFHL